MQRLFLIGPMGAGKTTLGKLIARELDYQFIDSDRVIEERTGVSIPTIFDIEGEAGFRERESRIIDELTQLDNTVLATGGGAILRPENRDWLHDRGFVVYLKVSIRQQLERTSRDRSRPLLQTPDPAATLTEMAKLRAPLYETTAHFSINTNHSRTRTLKNKIIAAFEATAETIEQ
ncbi:MAG TPA: shikimate kinase AroK [Gammaproteobacteria bacterium]|nr:shikimate kinase AroK [Gammaproteobacteria bacterium]